MGRTPCCEKKGLKKGPWTAEEDRMLMDYIEEHGHGSWRTLPKNAGLARCGKSCRLRWANYLRPDIKRGRFSFEEEETIIQLHSILGNKWSAIAARLPGRTDNEIKNYWNTHIRKRLLRMGIDPVTHSPRLDLSTLLTNPTLYAAAAQVDFSRLVGFEPFISSGLLRIASHLLQQQNLQDSQVTNNSHNQDALLQSVQGPSQLMQANVEQFQTCHDQTNMWHGTGIQGNSLDNLAPDVNFGCESLGQSATNFVPDDSSFYVPNIQNCNLAASVLPTPVSSPTQLNSSSNTYFNSSTEDEKDSYCSQLLKFQVPDLMDLSEFM